MLKENAYRPRPRDFLVVADAVESLLEQRDNGAGFRWQFDLVDGELHVVGWLPLGTRCEWHGAREVASLDRILDEMALEALEDVEKSGCACNGNCACQTEAAAMAAENLLGWLRQREGVPQ